MTTVPEGRMVRVVLPHATYGVVIDPETMVVLWSPPMARWMTGKPWPGVREWLRGHGARLTLLPRDTPGDQ